MPASNNHLAAAPAATVAKPLQVVAQAMPQAHVAHPSAPTNVPQYGLRSVGGLLSVVVLSVFAGIAIKWAWDAWTREKTVALSSSFQATRTLGRFLKQHRVVIAAVAIYLVILAACSYLDDDKGVLHKMITGFLPFVGTLVGAGVAFLGDRLKEDKRIEDSQVIAINRALNRLSVQLGDVERVKRAMDVTDNLGALPMREGSGDRIDTDELAFLVDQGFMNDLHALNLTQGVLDMAFVTLQHRNVIFMELVQPVIYKHIDSNISGEDLAALLGKVGYGKFKSASMQVELLVAHAVESTPTVMEKLTKIGKELFPHRVILKTAAVES